MDGRVVLGPAKNRDALSKRPLSFPADCPFAHLVQWTVEENDELMAALDPSLVVPEGPEDEEPPAAKVAVPKETPTAIASLLKQISVIIDEKSRAVQVNSPLCLLAAQSCLHCSSTCMCTLQAANLNGLQPPSLPRVVFMKLLQDHGSKEVRHL